MLFGDCGKDRGVLGGFNMICFPFERKRGARTSFSVRRFFDVNEELGLRYIPLQGGPFTLRGGRNNGSMSKLDRFLFFGDWEEYFSNVVQTNLPRPTSDHSSILLDVGGINRGPFPSLHWILSFQMQVCLTSLFCFCN